MKIYAIGNFIGHAWFDAWQGFDQGLRALEGVSVVTGDMRVQGMEGILVQIRRERPDVIIAFQLEGVHNAILDLAADLKAFVAFWMTEYRPDPVARDLAGRLHFMALTTESLRSAYARAWGLAYDDTRWLPYGAVRRDVPPVPSSRYAGKILFYGTMGSARVHGRRRELLTAIRARFWGRSAIENTGQDMVRFEEEAPHMASYLAGAAICFDCSRADAPGYTSNRIFTITGASGFYFGVRFPLFDQLFDADREAIVFEPDEPADDILRYLEYWLDLPRRVSRDCIRLAAWKRVQAEHLYEHRIRQLWGWIRERM